jgi:putative oxidoreductase
MAMQAIDTHELITPSPMTFNGLDATAVRYGDFFALVGRICLGWLFLASGWPKLMNIAGFTAYLTNLKVPAPGFWAWPAVIGELVIGITLIFGIATRYASVFTVIYLIITIALAHRYWEYPAPQQMAQYNNFLKNIAIMSGAFLLFVTGAGRFSVDGWLRKQGR